MAKFARRRYFAGAIFVTITLRDRADRLKSRTRHRFRRERSTGQIVRKYSEHYEMIIRFSKNRVNLIA